MILRIEIVSNSSEADQLMKNAPDADEVDAFDARSCILVGIALGVAQHMVVLADDPSD